MNLLRYNTLEIKKQLDYVQGSIGLASISITLPSDTKSRRRRALEVEAEPVDASNKKYHLESDAIVLLRIKSANKPMSHTIFKGSYTEAELKAKFSRISEYIIFTKGYINIHKDIEVVIGTNLAALIGLIQPEHKYISGFHALNQAPTAKVEKEEEKPPPVILEINDSIFYDAVEVKNPTKPRILYLTCDQLDIKKQSYNGELSNILAMIPTNNQKTITYTSSNIIYCALNDCENHQELTFKLLDQHMNPIDTTSIHFTILLNKHG